jgi:hypothetical protein
MEVAMGWACAYRTDEMLGEDLWEGDLWEGGESSFPAW